MSAISIILLAIFLWFMYNLLVKFVLPVYKTTKQLRKQFKNMAKNRQESADPYTNQVKAQPKQKVGEYIEFEEVG